MHGLPGFISITPHTLIWKFTIFEINVLAWSIFSASPSSRRASAGMISPSLMLIISPGTRIAASCSSHCPSLRTYIRGDTMSLVTKAARAEKSQKSVSRVILGNLFCTNHLT